MDLLIFAHRGEAQSFLKEMPLKSHPSFKDLYLGPEQSLLITGEGFFNVMSAVSRAIGLLEETEKKVTKLINLGICAAFEPELKKSEIYPIRTIYGQDEFKSFQTLNAAQAKIDVITAKERVLKTEQAHKLKCFAPLADREAWAIGFVAKQTNLGLECYKIVSDHVSDAPLCEYIKEIAQSYSEELLKFYLTKSLASIKSEATNPLALDKDFYLTVSMEREVLNLIKQLSIKSELSIDEILNDTDITELREVETTPKKRALLLRDLLKRKLYPTRNRIIDQLDRFIRDAGFSEKELSYDPSLEKLFLNLRSGVTSQSDIDQLKKKLTYLNWESFEEIMNGELL